MLSGSEVNSLQKCFSGLQKLQLPFFPGDWATMIRNLHQQTHSVYSICILRVLHCPGDRSFWALWGCCWNKHVLINVPSSKYSELKPSKTGNTAAFISYFLLTEHRTLGVIYMNMNESSICQCCESFDSNVLTQHGADTLIKPSNASADFKSRKKWLKGDADKETDRQFVLVLPYQIYSCQAGVQSISCLWWGGLIGPDGYCPWQPPPRNDRWDR